MVPSRGESPTVGRDSAPTAPPAGIGARFWALLCAERLAESNVVDVGTGTGRVALALAPHARRVIGLDRDAAALTEARHHAAAAGLTNVEFLDVDAETLSSYRALAPDWDRPDLVVAHLCVSDRIVDNAGRSLAADHALAFVAFHADQWKETGRRSRFAYDEDHARRVLAEHGFVVEHLWVERDVQEFASVEEALAAAIGLAEKWRADGRWFRYVKFLEDGGRTLTRAHLHVVARKT
jgi:SAM-dependent methyltransferase